jgi:two-component system sensor histidine kinase/response regulator
MRIFRDDYADVAGRLVDLFVRSTPPLLTELRTAVERDDARGIRRAAHTLKGSCQNVGASFMADLCRALEAGHAEPRRVLDQLDFALARTEATIRRRIAPAAR